MNTKPTEPTPEEATGFECENCGYKPTVREVIDHNGDCPKCRDTIIAYSIDVAKRFAKEREEAKALLALSESNVKDCQLTIKSYADTCLAYGWNSEEESLQEFLERISKFEGKTAKEWAKIADRATWRFSQLDERAEKAEAELKAIREKHPYNKIKDAIKSVPDSEQSIRDDAVDEFIDDIISELEKKGIDCSNWDGDEGVVAAISDGIIAAIDNAKEQLEAELKEVCSLADTLVTQVREAGWHKVNYEELDAKLRKLAEEGKQ